LTRSAAALLCRTDCIASGCLNRQNACKTPARIQVLVQRVNEGLPFHGMARKEGGWARVLHLPRAQSGARYSYSSVRETTALRYALTAHHHGKTTLPQKWCEPPFPHPSTEDPSPPSPPPPPLPPPPAPPSPSLIRHCHPQTRRSPPPHCPQGGILRGHHLRRCRCHQRLRRRRRVDRLALIPPLAVSSPHASH